MFGLSLLLGVAEEQLLDVDGALLLHQLSKQHRGVGRRSQGERDLDAAEAPPEPCCFIKAFYFIFFVVLLLLLRAVQLLPVRQKKVFEEVPEVDDLPDESP